ncbi:MAG: MerR family transcriptional regulator [Coriobacteriia bacterium]|nr:MerR family transcriptional regulator [Coriobacteriia bacterium]
MFKIGEFSKITQVSIRMLRYYDEAGLLKPSETDKFTNYRLYSVEQIPTVNKIKFLRDLGFNITEIALALASWDDGYILGLLEDKQAEIQSLIEAEQGKLSKIELAKRDIFQQRITTHYNVSLKSVPSYQVFSLRRVVSDYFAEGALWQEMNAMADKLGVKPSDNAFTIYHDEGYRDKDVDIEVCVPVAQIGEAVDGFAYRHTEHVPIMASTMVYGPFDNIASAYLDFASWLQAHNQYIMGETSRQVVYRGPWNEEDPEKYLSEIQIPLTIRKQ